MSKIVNFLNKTMNKNQIGTMPFGSLYDLNKQIMNTKKEGSNEYTHKPLSHLELAAIQSKVEDWFNMIIDTYAMLLCHELRDYTIFHLYEKENKNPPAVAAKEFLGCLIDRGEILSIDETADKAWEIWLRINDQSYCYYLFRYDNAVIEC